MQRDATKQPSGASLATDEADPGGHGVTSYVFGYLAALALTGVSFWAADTGIVWQPGVPILLAVLAIAQMGIHLAFFLHISSAPEHANDLLALALGIFVVGLIIFGSLWIMANLDHNMLPMAAP